MAGGEDSGVSPMVGTVLILAISIVGITFALLMGAPALERLQEQSSLDSMVAQLGTVREAMDSMRTPGDGRNLGVNMPSGSMRLEAGASWMVTMGNDTANPGCDFQVVDWDDGDSEVHVVQDAGCRDLVGDPQVDCALTNLGVPLLTSACIEVARVDGDTETRIAPASASAPGTAFVLTEDIETDEDYVFRLTNRAGTTYAEAWLLRGDRLHWAGGRVAADLEAGAVLASGRAGDNVVRHLRVQTSEGTDPAILVLPLMQAVFGSEIAGGGTHALDVHLNASSLRHQDTSYLTRVDLLGDTAELLCASFLAHSEAADEAFVDWVADGDGGACGTSGTLDTDPPLEDDTVSVRYDPPNGSGSDLPVFVLTQMTYETRLRP